MTIDELTRKVHASASGQALKDVVIRATPEKLDQLATEMYLMLGPEPEYPDIGSPEQKWYHTAQAELGFSRAQGYVIRVLTIWSTGEWTHDT